MSMESLEAKLRRIRDPVQMLRNSATKRLRFDYPDACTNWQDEQAGWS